MRRFVTVIVTLAVVAACGSESVVPAANTGSSTDEAVEPTAAVVEQTAGVVEPTAAVVEQTAEAVEPTAAVVYGDRFPEVLAVDAVPASDGAWRFSVTMSSPYDAPERYADAWRVLDADDNELGVRVLLHDHASEQPFTRSHTVDVPADTSTVYVEGRDQQNGWSGQRFAFSLSPG